MAAHFGRIERMVVLAFILGAASAAPADSQDAAGQMAQEMRRRWSAWSIGRPTRKRSARPPKKDRASCVTLCLID